CRVRRVDGAELGRELRLRVGLDRVEVGLDGRELGLQRGERAGRGEAGVLQLVDRALEGVDGAAHGRLVLTPTPHQRGAEQEGHQDEREAGLHGPTLAPGRRTQRRPSPGTWATPGGSCVSLQRYIDIREV